MHTRIVRTVLNNGMWQEYGTIYNVYSVRKTYLLFYVLLKDQIIVNVLWKKTFSLLPRLRWDTDTIYGT